MKNTLILISLILLPLITAAQHLKVSSDNRYLETSGGRPFFWLGDTAWELFHKLNREDAAFYLKNRADKGFTVIQAVILAELDGLKTPNAYGEIPLIDLDPERPNEKYFEHVDFIVNEAARLGLTIGMLPTWGDKVTPAHGGGPVIFNRENARSFGEFLGRRYRDKPIVWILGGDRDVANDEEKLVWRAMAEGLKKGDEGRHMISYHPRGYNSSHEKLHHESWLDFNMYQSGHSVRYNNVFRFAEVLRGVMPRKPFVEAEPAYEDIPLVFWEFVNWNDPMRVPAGVLHPDHTIARREHFTKGFFTGHDVRVHAYWNILAGACGYTYGNNAVWQMFEKGGSFAIPCLTDWREALDRPGAESMTHLRAFFETYPFHLLEPAQDRIINNVLKDSLHIRAAHGKGPVLLVYAASGQELILDLTGMDKRISAKWFDPRSGKYSNAGKFRNSGIHRFTPPSSGTGNDWMLILGK